MTSSVAGAPQPARPAGFREPLFVNERTSVWRGAAPDGLGTAVYKETSGRSATARIDHETSILQRLSGVAGVIGIQPSQQPRVLVMQDVGGRTLAEVLAERRLGVVEALDLAHGVATALQRVHEAGVIHRDLHPGNILLAADGTPWLVDFDLATTFAEVRPGFTHHTEILGRLPYLAPEQTGRTGTAVDLRSDLYALGAVLYEILAGRPVFLADDPLDLLRHVLAATPVPLTEVAPGTPAALASVVGRLLEKEPDRRYRSAAGLRHDLTRLRSDLRTVFTLGERDFAARLAAPTSLIGRAAETEALVQAFRVAADAPPAQAAPGSAAHPHRAPRAVLVTGGPGVGKSALVDALRPVVTDRGGWFVAGKSDQFRPGSAEGLLAPLRSLARLLLAEEPDVLDREVRRLTEHLGSNGPLLASMVPEFAPILGERPAPEDLDLVGTEDRTRQAVVRLLRAVASPGRPVVLALDDLQWAPPGLLDVVDALLDDDELTGLLLVAGYRDTEVGQGHPLTGRLDRWDRLGVSPTVIRLGNLPPRELTTLLAHVLRLPADRAAELAEVVGERTGGNPYETMELLNALRAEGALLLGESGWVWDPETIRHHVGSGDVIELLTARIDRLPADSAATLSLIACLGGEVGLPLLEAAEDTDRATLRERLTPPLEAGLLTPVAGNGAPGDGEHAGSLVEVRFRHDRVQQAAHDRLPADRRQALRLAAAGRLTSTAAFRHQAAAQFLAAGVGAGREDDVRPAEPETVLRLYQEAAGRERRGNNLAAEERFLAAACQLARSLRPPDAPELVTLRTEHHSALVRLGRLEQADEVYQAVRQHCSDPLVLADAVCMQIVGLTNRGRNAEALALGLALLADLAVPFPADDPGAEVALRIAEVAAWTTRLAPADDVARAPLADPVAVAAARVMHRMSAPAFFSDPLVSAWLVTEARRLWEEGGPSADLVPTLGHAGVACVALLGDYRAGHRLLRHLLRVSQARGYETAVAHARFLYAVSAVHWLEPFDVSLTEARIAREALQHAGDVQQAVWAQYPVVLNAFETVPGLDEAIRAAEAALLTSARAGNLLTQHSFGIVRQFCRAAEGRTASVTSFSDETTDERDFEPLAAQVPLAGAYWHHFRSLAAALAGDDELLVRHSGPAYRAGQALPGIILGLLSSALHAVGLGQQLRGLDPADVERRRLLQRELDDVVDWLAARAADQPENVQHLLQLAEAERAWALGDVEAAARAFDAGLIAVQRVSRPWQHTLLALRAGTFHLQRGLIHTGRLHLGVARQALADWGAAGLVAALDRRYPFLRGGSSLAGGSLSGLSAVSAGRGLTSDGIDMIAILRAAQALASRTNLTALGETIVDQLRVITGATDAHLVLSGPDGEAWELHPADRTGRGTPLDAAQLLVPVGAVRYVMRTRQPLMVDDARRDDRFARDPALADAERCALLVVPVLHSGDLRAVLVLENRLAAGSFTTDRLDAVTMLSGQLAVALDNARLYASLEERIADRTAELQAANAQLARLTLTDALTGVANRRQFDERLLVCWESSARGGTPLAAVMIDVDHFKAYNDAFGHQAGDACLTAVSAALSGCLRESDLLCRYGGEEFAVILPRAGQAAAAAVAERARAAVWAAALPHVPEFGVVTVSVGVASTVAAPGEEPAALVAAADAALYAAKRAGRNCVVVGAGPQPVDAGAPPASVPAGLPPAQNRPRTASPWSSG